MIPDLMGLAVEGGKVNVEFFVHYSKLQNVYFFSEMTTFTNISIASLVDL